MSKKVTIRKNFCMSLALHLEIKAFERRTGFKLNISKICRRAIKKVITTDPFEITTA